MQDQFDEIIDEVLLHSDARGWLAREIRRELRSHFADLAGELQREGYTADQIFPEALKRFGNISDIATILKEVHNIQPMRFTQQDKIAIGFGIALTWVSLIVSYRETGALEGVQFGSENPYTFNPNNPATVFATGGFPFKAYDYPMPVMGPGPEQSTLPLIGNFLFWILLCYGVLLLIKKHVYSLWLERLGILVAFFSTVIGLLYLLIRFD